MSFNISTWSIRKPVPTIVLFLVLTVVGWFSFTELGIDANPNIDFPAVSVTVTQPGAGPTELETQVTKKVEDAIAGLGNIDNMISTVNDGVSSTVVNFVLGIDSDRATNDVRNAIAQIRQNLPARRERTDRQASGICWRSHHDLRGRFPTAIGRRLELPG
jgi:multidrug efflux pump subunit AcrB